MHEPSKKEQNAETSYHQGGEEEEDEEDQDDLATAFQILDLARVCYGKRLEEVVKEEEEQAGKGKEAAGGDSPAVKHIKERLADTHDLLAEISLENERYACYNPSQRLPNANLELTPGSPAPSTTSASP